MKVTVLTYLDSEDESSKEYDQVVPQVARVLRRLGHRVSVLGAHGDVKRLIAGLSRRRPDLVFTLMEMFGDNVFGDIPVTGAALDLLGLRYTGSGPGSCT
jgi:D-alanine-D-alanine ligase